MTGVLALQRETAANSRKQMKFKINFCFLSVHRNLSAYHGIEFSRKKKPLIFLLLFWKDLRGNLWGNNGAEKSLKGHTVMK